MKRKEGKKFVFTDFKKNEEGITLLSVLFTLLIIMIVLPFIIHFFSHIQQAKMSTDLTVEQFFIFLRNDSLFADRVYSADNKLYFQLSSGKIAKIEQFDNVIRRQIDGEGHEIYIRYIESFSLQPLSFGTKVVIKTEEGAT